MVDLNTCKACKDGNAFDVPISMAFQPILSVHTREVYAYEALVRSADGGSASAVFDQVSDETLYAFDQKCRVTAIEWAHKLRIEETDAFLSINFLPNAVYNPMACIRLTLEAAERTGFPPERLMFEFTESERINTDHLLDILHAYQKLGFKTAIDDFGAGYAGLDLLARFQPDLLKLDMELVRDIDTTPAKQTIVQHITHMAHELGTDVICEGVETEAEAATLAACGLELMQGYYFAKPAFEALPDLAIAGVTTVRAAG